MAGGFGRRPNRVVAPSSASRYPGKPLETDGSDFAQQAGPLTVTSTEIMSWRDDCRIAFTGIRPVDTVAQKFDASPNSIPIISVRFAQNGKGTRHALPSVGTITAVAPKADDLR